MRACAGRSHRHARGVVKRHHARHHSSSKKKLALNQASPGASAPAQQPATCEDRSVPAQTAGAYVCADGSEPECLDGSEPVSTSASAPTCPAVAPGQVEWSDAVCADGSTPTAAGGAYSCDDSSQPECEDGSQPSSEPGSMLACVAYNPSGSPSDASSASAGD